MITLEPPNPAVQDVRVQFSQDSAFILYDSGNPLEGPTVYLQGVVIDEESGDILTTPLKVAIAEDQDGGYHADNDELSLYGYGDTVNGAIKDLLASLADTWLGLKDTDDTELTKDAIALRHLIARYLGRTLDAESGGN